MKISQVLFRYRNICIPALITLGFWEPLERMGGQHPSSTWLVLAGVLAQHRVLSIEYASLAVAALATLLALSAAMLRTWGTAYLGSGIMQDGDLHGERIVAAGPYRYLRNPLYLGSELHVLALFILMPPGGAVFAVLAIGAFWAVLIQGEEAHLLAEQGESYRAYMQLVPRIVPSLRSRVQASGQAPRWGQAIVGEIYMWGVALTFAALSWKYNAMLLVQGVLIFWGVSLVVRAFLKKKDAVA